LLAHQKETRIRGAASPRSASPIGPAPTRLPLIALPLLTAHPLVHLLIGIVLVLLMLIPALIYIDENYSTPIHNISLYWHFVDVIWVFLYAIFYLPGAHLK